MYYLSERKEHWIAEWIAKQTFIKYSPKQKQKKKKQNYYKILSTASAKLWSCGVERKFPFLLRCCRLFTKKSSQLNPKKEKSGKSRGPIWKSLRSKESWMDFDQAFKRLNSAVIEKSKNHCAQVISVWKR